MNLTRRQLFKRTAQVTAAAVVAPMVVVEAMSKPSPELYVSEEFVADYETFGFASCGALAGMPLFNTAHPMSYANRPSSDVCLSKSAIDAAYANLKAMGVRDTAPYLG